MSRWPSATTATQGFKCNHDGAEGWTLLADRVTQRTDRRVWTSKSWLQGNIHHRACEPHTVKFTSLQPICNSAPAIEGGLDKLFETIARTQRTRSGFANVSRQQKRQRFSRLFKWVQHEQTEKMRIYANVTRRWVNVLTSSLKAWAPPSWTADVTRSHAGGDIMTASSQNWSYFQNETLCSSWRDWGPRPRRLPDMWHCAIIESSGMQNLISELHFNPKVQGLWLQQITD